MERKIMYSIWSELASPLKGKFREAFLSYAQEVYKADKVVLTSYVPAEMGGSMTQENYLINMPDEDIPESYVTASYGECSSSTFAERFFKSGIYEEPEIIGYFPELMVVDLLRLGDGAIPQKYEDLCRDEYKGEVCLIGSPAIPDPTVATLIYRKHGQKALMDFVKNIAGYAAPVDTIRHIGKSSNKFGAVFIMPSLFAYVCTEKRNASVIIPESGAAAEPIISMYKANSAVKKYIRDFVFSDAVRMLLEEKTFPAANCELLKIDELCKKSITSELETVFLYMKP